MVEISKIETLVKSGYQVNIDLSYQLLKSLFPKTKDLELYMIIVKMSYFFNHIITGIPTSASLTVNQITLNFNVDFIDAQLESPAFMVKLYLNINNNPFHSIELKQKDKGYLLQSIRALFDKYFENNKHNG